MCGEAGTAEGMVNGLDEQLVRIAVLSLDRPSAKQTPDVQTSDYNKQGSFSNILLLRLLDYWPEKLCISGLATTRIKPQNLRV